MSEGSGGAAGATPEPIYPLAKDYAAYLKSYALGIPRLIAAAKHNLDHGPNFSEWSFA